MTSPSTLPSGWREVTLRNLCSKIGSGATPRGGKEVYLDHGPYTLIRSQNVYTSGFEREGLAFIGETHADELRNVEVAERDVLLNITGDSVARVCQVPVDVLPSRVNQHVAIIRPDDSNLDAGFLRYYLVSPLTQELLLSWAGSGGTRNALTKGLIESLQIPLPPVEEQREIAGVLGTLDDKIELNRRMNETLEGMARSLFTSWFVDFEPVRAKMDGRWRRGESLPGLPAEHFDLFPDTLVPSQLGPIPKGWQVKPLEEVTNMTRGRSYRSAELSESTVALVTLKSVRRGGGYSADGLKSYTGPYHQDQVLIQGDIVVAQTDVTQAAEVIGRAARVLDSPDYDTLVASLDMLILRSLPPLTNNYMYRLLQSDEFVNHTSAYVNGTTVLHLHKDAVPSFLFPLPPQRTIDRFSDLLSDIDRRASGSLRESRTLAEQRDALLPRLVSGEVRV